MTMQLYPLVLHPTVIAPTGKTSSFHGWGVLLGR